MIPKEQNVWSKCNFYACMNKMKMAPWMHYNVTSFLNLKRRVNPHITNILCFALSKSLKSSNWGAGTLVKWSSGRHTRQEIMMDYKEYGRVESRESINGGGKWCLIWFFSRGSMIVSYLVENIKEIVYLFSHKYQSTWIQLSPKKHWPSQFEDKGQRNSLKANNSARN